MLVGARRTLRDRRERAGADELKRARAHAVELLGAAVGEDGDFAVAAVGVALFLIDQHPVTFGPGATLVAGGTRSAGLWNAATGKSADALTDNASQGVFSLAYGPAGILAVGGNYGRADRWNMTYRDSRARTGRADGFPVVSPRESPENAELPQTLRCARSWT